MGTWGTGILQDDFAQDVYDRYVDRAARGVAPQAIIDALRVTHAGELASSDADAVFWLAVAHAQRDSASLQPDVVGRVTAIVEQGIGLEPWAELGGGEVGRRKSVLTRFLRTLTRPAPAGPGVPAASSTVDVTPAFDLGDCLSVRLPDGGYAGVVVTRRNDHPSAPSLIVSVADVAGPTAPEADAFSPLRWQRLAPGPHPDKVVKFQVFSEGLARSRKRYQVVCRIDPGRVPEPLVLKLANWGTLWRKLPDALTA
jgi:hypothetical protein